MKVTIAIDCDNAAFVESASSEVARILRDLAEHVVMLDMNAPLDPYDKSFNLRDINGNKVGRMEVHQ